MDKSIDSHESKPCAISLKSVCKRYEQNGKSLTVFDGLDVGFEEKGITAILGPSGCGKTTLLRLIAGLEEPTEGTVSFASPEHRIGMIFQEYTAFPWRTVEGNIAFGMEINGTPKRMKSEKIEFWLDKTGLRKFRNYYPSQLSGGMKQRLAFARSLAIDPTILLMDEPFGSLDAISREQMSEFAEDLLQSLNITSLFVTHSVREAVLFADRIIVMTNHPSSVCFDEIIRSSRPRGFSFLQSESAIYLENKIRGSLS